MALTITIPGLAGEQCIDDPIELGRPECRLEPVQRAAKVDQRDAIAAREMLSGERSSRAHGSVERPARSVSGLGERVEQQHDIAGMLWVTLGHMQDATSRREAPVDSPHSISRRERTDVGELDARSACRRDVRTQERLGAQRRHQLPQTLLAGKYPQEDAPLEPPISGGDAERFPRR